MERFELLRKIAVHAQQDPMVALWAVAYLAGDMDTDGLERCLKGIHELVAEDTHDQVVPLLAERFGVGPAAPR